MQRSSAFLKTYRWAVARVFLAGLILSLMSQVNWVYRRQAQAIDKHVWERFLVIGPLGAVLIVLLWLFLLWAIRRVVHEEDFPEFVVKDSWSWTALLVTLHVIWFPPLNQVTAWLFLLGWVGSKWLLYPKIFTYLCSAGWQWILQRGQAFWKGGLLPIIGVLLSPRKLLSHCFPQEPSNAVIDRPLPGYLYWGAGAGLYIGYIALQFPPLLVRPEIWAEMGREFYPVSLTPGFWNQLLTPHFAYLTFLRVFPWFYETLHLPAAGYPYYLSCIAVILSVAWVGSFCHVRYRVLIPSDLARFGIVILVWAVANYEIRTFINFPYLAVFFVAIQISYYFTKPQASVTWSAYFLPIIVVSKPVFLIFLPVFVGAFILVKGRLRWILGTASVGLLLQLYVLIQQQAQGMHLAVDNYTLVEKLTAIVWHWPSMTVAYLLQDHYVPFLNIGSEALIPLGSLLLLVMIFSVLRQRQKSNALVAIGLWIMGGGVALLCMTGAGLGWNVEMLNVLELADHTDRWTYSILIGFLIAFLGTLQILLQRVPKFVFVVWIAWALYTGVLLNNLRSGPPPFPENQASAWPTMAPVLDQSPRDVCVPINPYPWMYATGRCELLSEPLAPNSKRIQLMGKTKPLLVAEQLENSTLFGVAFVTNQKNIRNRQVKLTIHTKDRHGKMASQVMTHQFHHQVELLYTPFDCPVSGVRYIVVEVDRPLDVMPSAPEGQQPAMTFYGTKSVVSDVSVKGGCDNMSH